MGQWEKPVKSRIWKEPGRTQARSEPGSPRPMKDPSKTASPAFEPTSPPRPAKDSSKRASPGSSDAESAENDKCASVPEGNDCGVAAKANLTAFQQAHWTCVRCDEENRASRMECNNCGQKKVDEFDPWTMINIE